MAVGDKIRNRFNVTVKAPQDSLKNIQLANVADSLVQDSVRNEIYNVHLQDSLAKEAKKLVNHDLVKDQYKFDGPVASKYLNEDELARLEENIHQLNAKRVSHLANTNIDNNYVAYQNLIEDIDVIHDSYNVDVKEEYIPNFGVEQMPTYPTDSKYWGPNRYDLIWPNENVKNMSKDELGKNVHDLDDSLFDSLTVSRLIANNPEIKIILEGRYDVNENNEIVKKNAGMIDYMHKYDLGGESSTWVNFKEGFGSRANVLKLIDNAVNAKLNHSERTDAGNYFTGMWDNISDKIGLNYTHGSYQHKTIGKEVPGADFVSAIQKLPHGEQKIVLTTLQNMVNEIVDIGLAIEKDSDLLLSEYHKYKEQFPKRTGVYTHAETPYDNADLKKAKELDKEIGTLMESLKYYTGKEFDLINSYDRISIDSLGVELDNLSDIDKTEGGQEMLILLSEELRSRK